MSDYPEHEKLKTVADRSQTIGEFLDWLGTQSVQLMVWRTFTDRNVCSCTWNEGHTGQRWSSTRKKWITCGRCGGEGLGPEFTVERWAHVGKPITELLAEFFEIDLEKIETEKRAMLASLR